MMTIPGEEPSYPGCMVLSKAPVVVNLFQIDIFARLIEFRPEPTLFQVSWTLTGVTKDEDAELEKISLS